MLSEGMHVELTPQIGALLKAAWSRSKELPSDLKSVLEPYAPSLAGDAPTVSSVSGVKYSVLKQAWTWMSNEGVWEGMFLHELMRGTAHFVPPAPVVEKDPAYVERLDHMRRQVENRLYAKMVANVSNEWMKRAEEAGRADLKTGLDTAKISLNLLFSVAAVFIATYFVIHNSYQNTIISISVASIAAIGIFLVETILFVLRGSQLDAKVSKQRQDADLGQSSPFPPTAPSLIEAQRKLRIENSTKKHKADTNSNSLNILQLDGFSDLSTASHGIIKEEKNESDDDEAVQPLLLDKTAKPSKDLKRDATSSPTRMARRNGGGAVIDDE